MQGQFPPDHIPYRADIDGLRAIAVVAVLLFHADVAPFRGGYVGVDVFFVISGYLIMSTLLADIRASRFSIVQFYRRRVRRIFPALFVSALFCTLAGAVLFAPKAYADFGKSLIAMALFVSNMFFLQETPDSYFAIASDTNLLLHTWSLAVEEQFYILLPLGLVFLRRCRTRTMRAWLFAFAVASFLASVWLVAIWPMGAFYLVVTRAWELLLGSLLAFGVGSGTGHRSMVEAAACAGLGLILFAVFAFSRTTAFPGAAAVLPTIGAGLVIYGSTARPCLVGRLLSMRPVVGIGLISYSLYLWHWPIIVIIKYCNMNKIYAGTTVLAVVLSFVLGFLSYRFVELPFRRIPIAVAKTKPFISAGLAASFVTASIGVLIVAGHGLPQRLDAATRRIVAANAAREQDLPDHDECANWKRPVSDEQDISFCAVAPEAAKKVLFIGDSHMHMLRPLVRRLFEDGAFGKKGALFAVSAGCVPVTNLNRVLSGYRCPDFFRSIYWRAEAPDIDTVFIAYAAWWSAPDTIHRFCLMENGVCGRELSQAEMVHDAMSDLRTHVVSLRKLGKQVVLALPAPAYWPPIPEMEIRFAMLRRISNALVEGRVPKRIDYSDMRGQLIALAAETGSRLFDFRASLCRGSQCTYAVDGVSLYIDDSHIANRNIGLFRDSLRAALR